jgi:hypothetical protein
MRKFIAGLIGLVTGLILGAYGGYQLAWHPQWKTSLGQVVSTVPGGFPKTSLVAALIAFAVALRALWKVLRKTSSTASNVFGLIALVVAWVNRESLSGLINGSTLPWIVVATLASYLVADKLRPARAVAAPPALSRRSGIFRRLGNKVGDGLYRAGQYLGLVGDEQPEYDYDDHDDYVSDPFGPPPQSPVPRPTSARRTASPVVDHTHPAASASGTSTP